MENENVLTNFKIIEKEVIVEVPKYVDVTVERPKYVDKTYERPVLKNISYERPSIVEKDLTKGLNEIIKAAVERGVAEVMQSLKVSLEIPMGKILQVRPK